VSFLRRMLGGGGPVADPAARPGADAGATAEVDEAERERRLLREEAERLDDELVQRQLRYADRSWVPPAQGGTRRADDAKGEVG
jgi:hypothetical protein